MLKVSRDIPFKTLYNLEYFLLIVLEAAIEEAAIEDFLQKYLNMYYSK